jgi:outer membrane protein
MKKIILTLALALFSVASFSQKYAYVDTKYILENIPEYKTAQKQLDDLSELWQKEIEEKYKAIDKKYKEYQAEQVLLPDDMKRKREEEIIALEKEVKAEQKQRFGVKGDLYQKRKELIEPIQNKVYNAIKELATTANYAFVFDKSNQTNILYADPKLDKSKRVLKTLGY